MKDIDMENVVFLFFFFASDTYIYLLTEIVNADTSLFKNRYLHSDLKSSVVQYVEWTKKAGEREWSENF